MSFFLFACRYYIHVSIIPKSIDAPPETKKHNEHVFPNEISQVVATWTSLNDTASEKHVERMAEMVRETWVS